MSVSFNLNSSNMEVVPQYDSDEHLSEEEGRFAMEKIAESRKRSWRRCFYGALFCIALMALVSFFLGEKVAGKKVIEKWFAVEGEEIDEIEEELELEHRDRFVKFHPNFGQKGKGKGSGKGKGRQPDLMLNSRFGSRTPRGNFYYIDNGWCSSFADQKIKSNEGGWEPTLATDIPSKTGKLDKEFSKQCGQKCMLDYFCIGFMTKLNTNGQRVCTRISTTDLWASGGIFMASKTDKDVHCWARREGRSLETELYREKFAKDGKSSGVAVPLIGNKLCASNGQQGSVEGSAQLCKDSTGDGRIFVNDCDRTCIEYRCMSDPNCIGFSFHGDFFRPLSMAEDVVPNARWKTFLHVDDNMSKVRLPPPPPQQSDWRARARIPQKATDEPNWEEEVKQTVDDSSSEKTTPEPEPKSIQSTEESDVTEVQGNDLKTTKEVLVSERVPETTTESANQDDVETAKDDSSLKEVVTATPEETNSGKDKEEPKATPESESNAENDDSNAADEGSTTTKDSTSSTQSPGSPNLDAARDIHRMQSIITRLQTLKKAIEKMKAMLVEYYTVPTSKISAEDVLEKTFLHGPNRTQEVFAKAEEAMADRFLRALLYDRKFTVGAIGSSVTAGHDNCHYDCYEEQLNRLMQPVFSEAGFEFECLNAGMTGNCGDNYMNQPMCMQHTLGLEVDLVHYSWTYFEHQDVEQYQERFIRWAYQFPHRAIPTILNTDNCNKHLDNGKARPKMYAKYGEFGMNYLCMQGGVYEATGFDKGKPGFEKGSVGDKLHETTRYGENETDKVRQRSLGVGFRNWHPGPLIFQTVADALGWQYSNAILKAIDMILAEENPKMKWAPFPEAIDLGEPSHCNPEICATNTLPSCNNFETPTYGQPSVAMIDPSDGEYPYDASSYNWRRKDGPITNYMPRQEMSKPECKHLDHCSGWQRGGMQDSGWIVFKFSNLETGHILFCCQDKKGGKEALESGQLIAELDGEKKELSLIMGGKCILVQERFVEPSDKDRSHFLGVFQPKSAHSICTIDHVMGI